MEQYEHAQFSDMLMFTSRPWPLAYPGKTHKLRSEYLRGNFHCLRFVKRSLDKSVHVHSRAHKMLRDLTEAGNAPPFGSHVDPPTVMWLALRTAA